MARVILVEGKAVNFIHQLGNDLIETAPKSRGNDRVISVVVLIVS